MDLYTSLVSKVLFPVHERLKGHDSLARLRLLERSQWWTPQELALHRTNRLHALLRHAELHVPYYRHLFAAHGIDTGSTDVVNQLRRIPCLTKAIIRGNSDRLRSDAAGPLKRYNTGGSSGEPLVFFMGKDRISHDVAAKWRATRWWGVDIGDPEIVIWGSPIEVGGQDRVKALRDRVLRTHLLPAFAMSDDNLARFVDAIRRIRPRMIFGYPSALAHIATYARERKHRLDDVGLRVAFVTSERLYDHQRERIRTIFGCPVANGYGGRDAGFIAHECPSGGMHISAEDIIVETVDETGRCVPAGEAGEIVVTHLATGDFPFIRYRTGDVGVLDDSPCACGRSLPLLKEIQGRTTDFVVAYDGTVIHGLALIYVIRDLPGIRQFKIVQERIDLTRVTILPDDHFDPSVIPQIEKGFKQRLGGQVEVRVDCVSELPAERSGKHRYVTSHVVAGSGTAAAATQAHH